MVEHKFGGDWTETKLEILRKYLGFYTQALKNQRFHLVYMDGFAGSGNCVISKNGSQLKIPGSAKIALENEPPFQHLIFIEKNPARFESLKKLCDEHSGSQKVMLFHGDANEQIKRACNFFDSGTMRVMAFIDPYGLEIEWEVLVSLAQTKCADVLFLFPLSGLYRQTPRKVVEFDPDKSRSLDRLLGTGKWRQQFYERDRQGDLFLGDDGLRRNVSYQNMMAFVQKRMEEHFPFVSKPLILPQKGSPRFALWFAVSNPSVKAIGLAKRVYNQIVAATV